MKRKYSDFFGKRTIPPGCVFGSKRLVKGGFSSLLMDSHSLLALSDSILQHEPLEPDSLQVYLVRINLSSEKCVVFIIGNIA